MVTVSVLSGLVIARVGKCVAQLAAVAFFSACGSFSVAFFTVWVFSIIHTARRDLSVADLVSPSSQ